MNQRPNPIRRVSLFENGLSAKEKGSEQPPFQRGLRVSEEGASAVRFYAESETARFVFR